MMFDNFKNMLFGTQPPGIIQEARWEIEVSNYYTGPQKIARWCRGQSVGFDKDGKPLFVNREEYKEAPALTPEQLASLRADVDPLEEKALKATRTFQIKEFSGSGSDETIL